MCRAVMVRNETHKLVLRGDPQDEDHHSELYDLTRDPRETENLGTNSKEKFGLSLSLKNGLNFG